MGGLTPRIDVSCHPDRRQALNHLVRYVLMTPFGWFSRFSFLTQCNEIKNIGASQILTKILIFQSFFSDGRADNAYYFFCKYSLEYMLLLWAQH